MNITKQQLKQIITEEVQRALKERYGPGLSKKAKEIDPDVLAVLGADPLSMYDAVEKKKKKKPRRARAPSKALAKPQDPMARWKAQRAARAKHIEKVVIPKYLAKGYKRFSYLPKLLDSYPEALKVGSYKVYRNSEVRTFKDFPIVLISLEPCWRCGARWSTWNVDPHELESMVGDSRTRPPIAAVLVKLQKGAKHDPEVWKHHSQWKS